MSFISLSKTPREVPIGLKIKLLIANIPFWFGMAFFVIGSVFLVVFSFNIDFKSVLFFPNQNTQGVIVGKESTNCSVNKKKVQKYTYRFEVGHRKLIGYSYTSKDIDPYNSVEVEYESSNPQNSRIVGMRLAPFSFWMLLFILIFPTVGILFIVSTIRSGLEEIHLLTHGILAKGKVIESKKTNTSINKKTIHDITFEFEDQKGKIIKAHCSTAFPEILLDDVHENLVYDPQNPEKAILIDTLGRSAKRFLLNQR